MALCKLLVDDSVWGTTTGEYFRNTIEKGDDIAFDTMATIAYEQKAWSLLSTASME